MSLTFLAAVLCSQLTTNEVFLGDVERTCIGVQSSYLERSSDLAYDAQERKLYVLWQIEPKHYVTRFDMNGNTESTWSLGDAKVPVSVLHKVGQTPRLLAYDESAKHFTVEEFSADNFVSTRPLSVSPFAYDLSLDRTHAERVRKTIASLGWRVDHKPSVTHPVEPSSLIERFLINSRELDLARLDTSKDFSAIALGWIRGFGPRIALRAEAGSYKEHDVAASLLEAIKEKDSSVSSFELKNILIGEGFVAFGTKSRDGRNAPLVAWYIVNESSVKLNLVRPGYLARTLVGY